MTIEKNTILFNRDQSAFSLAASLLRVPDEKCIFDPSLAVKVQQMVGMSADDLDGVIGPKTQKAMLDFVAKMPRVEVPLELGAARDLFGRPGVRWVADISKHNRITNYKTFVSRCDGVYVKATQGENTRDPMCATHVAKLREAGGNVFALYHYAQHVGITGRLSRADKAAQNLVGEMKKLGVEYGLLDLEPDAVSDAINLGWKAADFDRWVNIFVDEFSLLVGFDKLLNYCGGETARRAGGAFDWMFSRIPTIVPGYLPVGARWYKIGPWSPVNWRHSHFAGAQYRGGDNKKTVGDEGGKVTGAPGDIDCNWVIESRLPKGIF